MLRAPGASAHCTIHRSTKSKPQNVTHYLRTVIPIASCITYCQPVAPSGAAAKPTSRVRNDSQDLTSRTRFDEISRSLTLKTQMAPLQEKNLLVCRKSVTSPYKRFNLETGKIPSTPVPLNPNPDDSPRNTTIITTNSNMSTASNPPKNLPP